MIEILLLGLWVTVYNLLLAFYTKFQRLDEQDGDIYYNKNDRFWHYAGGLSRIWVAVLIWFLCYPLPGWDVQGKGWLIGAVGCYSAAAFDLLINRISLDKDWFYVPEPKPHSPLWDKLGRAKFYLYALGFLVCVLIHFTT